MRGLVEVRGVGGCDRLSVVVMWGECGCLGEFIGEGDFGCDEVDDWEERERVGDGDCLWTCRGGNGKLFIYSK